MADRLQSFSHDTINRYLRGEKLSPGLLWEQTQPLLKPYPAAYSVFDDTVLDHGFGPNIEMVRRDGKIRGLTPTPDFTPLLVLSHQTRLAEAQKEKDTADEVSTMSYLRKRRDSNPRSRP